MDLNDPFLSDSDCCEVIMQTLNCLKLNEVKIIQGQKLVCSQYRYLKSPRQFFKNLITS